MTYVGSEWPRPGYRPLRPGDPGPPFNPIREAHGFVERQAFRAYLLALLDEDPQFRAELRRRLLGAP